MESTDIGTSGPTSGTLVDGRYVIKREVARGGMGVVLEAEHKWIRTKIALKMLHGGASASASLRHRLMREARALSIARHPGIVSILDAGICREHGPYLALELFEARSLHGIIVARRSLRVGETLHVGLQLSAALARSHECGILHRDVKSNNVLVGRAAGQESDAVKLLDFGIAAVPGADDVVDEKITMVGRILGTPEYMAPELLVRFEPATVATEVYALGVILYECLTGDVPFAGTAPVIRKAMIEGARPTSIRSARDDVPAALEAVVSRAMAPEAAARFASMRELEAALKGIASPAAPPAIVAPPVPQGATRRRFPRAPYAAPARIVAAAGNFDGRIEDVSEGGLLIVTDAPCADGETVTVRFPLPCSGRILAVQAITRWARTRRGQRAAGLQFVELGEEARGDVRTYVDMMGGPATSDAL